MQYASKEQLETLRGLESSVVANAIDRLGIRPPTTGFASAQVRCLSPAAPRVVGHAVTCSEDTTTPRMTPGRGLADLYRAVADIPAPSIIAIKDIGHDRLRSVHLGAVMATATYRLGAVGFLSDGAVRDIDDIREKVPGYQVFAAGTVPAEGAPHILEIGRYVEICGLGIHHGDLLMMDADGILSVPFEHLDDILRLSREITDFEHARFQYIFSDGFTIDGLVNNWRTPKA